jgi:hypothetical protein
MQQGQGGSLVENRDLGIAKDFDFKPIYISSRTATLSAKFCPCDQLSLAQINSVRNIWERYALEEKYINTNMFDFSIHKLRSTERPIRFQMSCGSLLELLQLIESTEDGTWVSTAETIRLFEQLRFPSASSKEQNTEINILNSIVPQKVLKAGVKNTPKCIAGSIATGTKLSVYFRPNMPKEQNVKKPWIWEFKHYQLKRHEDNSVVPMNERVLSIQLSAEEIKRLARKLQQDRGLWESYQRTILFFKIFSDKNEKTEHF